MVVRRTERGVSRRSVDDGIIKGPGDDPTLACPWPLMIRTMPSVSSRGPESYNGRTASLVDDGSVSPSSVQATPAGAATTVTRMTSTATMAGPSIEPTSAQRDRPTGWERRRGVSRRARSSRHPSFGGSSADARSPSRRSAITVCAISVSSNSHRRHRARWSNAAGVIGPATRCSTHSVRAGRCRPQASLRPKMVTADARGPVDRPGRAPRVPARRRVPTFPASDGAATPAGHSAGVT